MTVPALCWRRMTSTGLGTVAATAQNANNAVFRMPDARMMSSVVLLHSHETLWIYRESPRERTLERSYILGDMKSTNSFNGYANLPALAAAQLRMVDLL